MLSPGILEIPGSSRYWLRELIAINRLSRNLPELLAILHQELQVVLQALDDLRAE